MAKEIGVGMVGYKFMGRAHSNAYRQAAAFFPDLPLVPAMRAICGRDAAGVAAAAQQLGWQSYETDWRKLIARDDIGVVDVSTPGDTHAEIAIAAAEAGKHVYCEKPLANTLDEARQMVAAVEKAGVINFVNFNYRRVPAVQFARQLIDQGYVGEIRHWRAVYLQDWIVDPQFPLVWRLQKELTGSGALGDIGAHIIDLARFLVGDITEVNGLLSTFIKERPVVGASDGGLGATAGKEMGKVTVDDAALVLAKFANGAIGTFEASRFATGRKNYNSFEINGSKGSIFFNLERLNELQVYTREEEAAVQGWKTVLVTEGDHPFAGAWWPAGHIIGWEHSHTHSVVDLMKGIAEGKSPAPTFADALKVQALLDAVEHSSDNGGWVKPEA
jgi:predicted dehydrogenase